MTPCDGLGCALIALTCCAYICTAVDQARVLFTADRGLMGFNFKVGAIVVKDPCAMLRGARLATAASFVSVVVRL